MRIKTLAAAAAMLALLGACDTMSEFGGKVSDSMSEFGTTVKGAFTSEPAADNKKYVVYFKSNSTALTETSEDTLSQALGAVQQDKVGKARVVAYTDSRGSPKYNQQLSMRRAESIRQKLSGAGVSSVEVAGAGEAPDGATATGDSARRAEIYLIK
jgi:outer membrane protein OmpA-like peptidoglycan-associated protein